MCISKLFYFCSIRVPISDHQYQDTMKRQRMSVPEHAEMEEEKLDYKWVIKNFNFMNSDMKVGETVESPLFTTAVDDAEIKWQFKLLFSRNYNGHLEEPVVSLFLNHHCASGSFIATKYTVDLYEKNKQNDSSSDYIQFSAFETFVGKSVANIIIQHQPLSVCLLAQYSETNNTLTVRFRLQRPNVSNDNNFQSNNLPAYVKVEGLDYLDELMKDEKFSDVILVVGGEIFRTHKCILANRSPVFAAMFERCMKGKAENRVEIKEIDHNVFQEMLRFIYTGKVIGIENIVKGLLAAADKYSIEGLKVMCEETLFKNVSTENAVEYLKTADLCNALDLKK